MLTVLLTLLGEEEVALIAGLWVEERGFHIADNAGWDYLDVASYLALQERQTEDELRALARRARSLGESDMLALVRSRLEEMGPAASASI
jgi:hypothetical protein